MTHSAGPDADRCTPVPSSNAPGQLRPSGEAGDVTEARPSSEGATLGRRVASEMIGTFALVFVGCGAIVVDATSGGALGHVGVSMVFGLVVMVMIYAVGHIGGAHFNPAVTVAFASAGHFAWRDVPAYVAGQCLAAIVAALLVATTLGHDANVGATTPATGVFAALVLETTLTFTLMFVISAVATDARAAGDFAGVAIGGTVALAALMGGPVCGASMNPARSLGPALAAGTFDSLWLYLSAPVVGAVAAAQAYRLLRE